MNHLQCVKLQLISKVSFCLGNVGVIVISAYVLSLNLVTIQYPWTELIYPSQFTDRLKDLKSHQQLVMCITIATVESERLVRCGIYRRISVPQTTMHEAGLDLIATSPM